MVKNAEYRTIAVIGAGISGMVAACYLRKAGYDVTVYEKHQLPGGRARRFSSQGFVFDMGPSWYWMPDIFESFFKDFSKTAAHYFQLIRLDPSYSVYFDDDKMTIPASADALAQLFEHLEPGSEQRLKSYLWDASLKYKIGMHRFAGKPALTLAEFITKDSLMLLRKLHPFRNMQQHVNRYFEHHKIRKIMQFPVIFLGAMPEKIPAMYSLMNYADTVLGTWYPQGGMYEMVRAVYSLATELGVQFKFNTDIDQIEVSSGRAVHVSCQGEQVPVDLVIGAGDYHYMEQLLAAPYRQYSEQYWQRRDMAPSCLLYYVGVNERLPLDHHNLFFDSSFEDHAHSLYNEPAWPMHPLFYVCAPSVTDPSVAPPGCENLFILVPVAAGLPGDSTEMRKIYFDHVLGRLENRTGMEIKEHVVYYRDYAISDFKSDYHAFLGNAYGLANTIRQTAFGKPRMRNKHVENLFYCGQLTVPGPGLPPAFLSGKMAAQEALKYMNKNQPSFTL